jgi:hypothetical protein
MVVGIGAAILELYQLCSALPARSGAFSVELKRAARTTIGETGGLSRKEKNAISSGG